MSAVAFLTAEIVTEVVAKADKTKTNDTMRINADQLLPTIQGCSWAHSNQYFPDSTALPHIGFTQLLVTDIFVHTSFSIASKLPITGAIIQTFTKDNAENENFVLYRLPFLNLPTKDAVTVQLHNTELISLLSIQNFLASLPWISLIVLNLFSLLLPKFIGTILFYINLAAIIVMIVVYRKRTTRFLLRMLGEKKITVGRKTVICVEPEDLDKLQDKDVRNLLPLVPEGVSRAVLYQNMLYLKQELDPKAVEESQTKMANVIAYLSSDSFISSLP